jgi:Tol biopolymer transport system component
MADRRIFGQWIRTVPRPGRTPLWLLLSALLAAGCGGSGGKDGPASLPAPGTPPTSTPASILFVSDRDGHKQIYVMAPDGTGVRRWMTSTADDTSPAWSPDHTRVAFVSNRNGASHVFVAGREGTNPRDLTPGTAVCGAPAWSPNGIRLAYVQWETTGAQANIRVMRADGSDSRPLTAGVGINGGPAWTARGTNAEDGPIYFASNRERGGTSFDLYVMDSSGSGQHKVAVISGLVGRPAVSPNGQQLVYTALVAPETPGLFVMDAGGAGAGRMVGPVNSAEPAWSPDGRRLVFTGWQDGNAEIYCMDMGGRNVKRLTANAAADGGAAW